MVSSKPASNSKIHAGFRDAQFDAWKNRVKLPNLVLLLEIHKLKRATNNYLRVVVPIEGDAAKIVKFYVDLFLKSSAIC